MRANHILLAGMTALVLGGCAHQPADMNTGKQAYSDEDYDTAFAHYSELAKFGVPEAKTELGRLYLSGRGTKADPAMALALFEEAKQGGDSRAERYIPGAQTKLGALTLNSKENTYNPQDGITLLYKAAEKNDPNALFELGKAHEEGKGVPQNGKIADDYYERSAALGYGRADYSRGKLYERGKLVPKNIPLALALYTQAGGRDYPRAWQQLGKLYENGKEVPMDLKKASEFYTLAKLAGIDVTQDEARLKEKSGTPLTLGQLISDPTL